MVVGQVVSTDVGAASAGKKSGKEEGRKNLRLKAEENQREENGNSNRQNYPTFISPLTRLKAPNAKAVALRGLWMKEPLPLTLGDEGVWSGSVGAIPAGVWEYNFSVDGVTMIDPRQAGPHQHRGGQAPDPAGLAPRPPSRSRTRQLITAANFTCLGHAPMDLPVGYTAPAYTAAPVL